MHFLHRCKGTSSRHAEKFEKGRKLLVPLATQVKIHLQAKLLSESLGAVPRDNTLEAKAFTPRWTDNRL